MTTERDEFEKDDLVTETYRELGAEKTPEHLNQAILQMASDGVKPASVPNLPFASWMKPVAWAATIGLSLAIVLELTQVPTTAVRSEAVPVVESTMDEVMLQDADQVEKKESRARMQIAPVGQSTADSVADDLEVLSREAKGKLDTFAAPAQSPSPAAAMQEVAPETPASPELPARKNTTDEPADSGSIASLAAFVDEREADTSKSCDTTARRSEQDWRECIAELRRSGDNEAADREHEAFILKYPIESQK